MHEFEQIHRNISSIISNFFFRKEYLVRIIKIKLFIQNFEFHSCQYQVHIRIFNWNNLKSFVSSLKSLNIYRVLLTTAARVNIIIMFGGIWELCKSREKKIPFSAKNGSLSFGRTFSQFHLILMWFSQWQLRLLKMRNNAFFSIAMNFTDCKKNTLGIAIFIHC